MANPMALQHNCCSTCICCIGCIAFTFVQQVSNKFIRLGSPTSGAYILVKKGCCTTALANAVQV
jgi:hypothetical protein